MAAILKPRRGSPNKGIRTNDGWREYSERKNAWIRANPQASYREIDAAARRIAKELGL